MREERKRKGRATRDDGFSSLYGGQQKSGKFPFFFFLLGNANNTTDGPADKVPPRGWQRSSHDCCRIRTTARGRFPGRDLARERMKKRKKRGFVNDRRLEGLLNCNRGRRPRLVEGRFGRNKMQITGMGAPTRAIAGKASGQRAAKIDSRQGPLL